MDAVRIVAPADRTSAAKGPVKLGNADDYPTDTATYVAEGRLYVINAGGQSSRALQKCPHLGCRVPVLRILRSLRVRVSRFDLRSGGEWVTGPAPRGMDRFPVSVEADQLFADTSKVHHRAAAWREPVPHAAQGPELFPGWLTVPPNDPTPRRSSPTNSNEGSIAT